MASRLVIHVLGPRFGESVILGLPDGSVGVIDSFASSGKHPVVAFLEGAFPTVTRLRFLAITHPHADHCFRAVEIIDRFWPSEIWMFHPFPSGQVQNYYTVETRRSELKPHSDCPPGRWLSRSCSSTIESVGPFSRMNCRSAS